MKHKSQCSRRKMQVVLGSQSIKAFVAAPKEFKVMGIVRMGMEFGLLAVNVSGTYLRVNGSTIEVLDQRAVDAALIVACSSGRGESYAATRQALAQGAPVVVVRKRRRVSWSDERAPRDDAPEPRADRACLPYRSG